MAKIIKEKLLLDGYVYLRSWSTKDRVYWDCRNVRSGIRPARAITNNPIAGVHVVVHRGPQESKHTHQPNQEECAGEVIVDNMKRKLRNTRNYRRHRCFGHSYRVHPAVSSVNCQRERR